MSETLSEGMQSKEIAKLVTALAKVQGELRGYREDSNNPFFRSKYGDLSSVWAAIRQPLADNGLAVVQTLIDGNGDNRIRLKTTLAHTSGEWISGVLSLRPVKDDPQAVGSAITYARRYSLAAIVGVAPEDDDGEAAQGRRMVGQAIHEELESYSQQRQEKQKAAQKKADEQARIPTRTSTLPIRWTSSSGRLAKRSACPCLAEMSGSPSPRFLGTTARRWMKSP